MNWLDLAILLTVAWFTIAGATAGLAREVVTLLALLLGLVVAGLFAGNLADDVGIVVENRAWAEIVAFALIALAVFGAGQIAAILLKGPSQTLALGRLNHGGGLVLGFLKGALLVQAALILFARYHIPALVDALDGSFLTPFFLDGAPVLLTLLPAEFRRAVEQFPRPLGA